MKDKWAFRAQLGVSQMVAAGDVVDFVTITSHEKLKDFAQTEHVWRSAWNKLYHALKRQKNDLQYMIVPERHKDNRMHVHAVWNAGVTERWLKDNARRRGLGHQAKVIHIGSERHIQKYITKYIGKGIGDDVPDHFRRVRVSHGFPDVPSPDNPLCALRWEYVGTNGCLHIVYEECEGKGYDLIDLETGAHFDDVDLGTMVYA